MIQTPSVVSLSIRSLRGRILLLLAFGAALLLLAVALRAVGGHDGHVDPDALFRIGGFPLVSIVLLAGYVLGRFPIIATLVMVAGLVSSDLAAGHTRLYAARPVSLLRLYGARLALRCGIAFLISALLLPAFDLILLGNWAGPRTFALIAAYVVAFGGLTAFLSVWFRADAWIAGLLAIVAIAWHALRSAFVAGMGPPFVRDSITMLLPPHGAMTQLERAFSALAPVPWIAFAYAVAYGMFWVLLGGLAIGRRQL